MGLFADIRDEINQQRMPDDSAAAIARIRTETESITHRNMKEMVAEYLAQQCRKDAALASAVMLPDKNMTGCFRYINRKAREHSGKDGCDATDCLYCQWAVEYFKRGKGMKK